MIRPYRGSAKLPSSLSFTRVSEWALNGIWSFLRPCLQASRFPLKRVKGTRRYKRNDSGRITLLPGTELRPVSFNKRRQHEEAFSKKNSWRAHVSPMFAVSQVSYTGNIVSSGSFCFQDANYAYATRQGILTKIRACEHLQNFCEHEQASTHLIFASNSSKGQILRALSNWMGPFDTPSINHLIKNRKLVPKSYFFWKTWKERGCPFSLSKSLIQILLLENHSLLLR